MDTAGAYKFVCLQRSTTTILIAVCDVHAMLFFLCQINIYQTMECYCIEENVPASKQAAGSGDETYSLQQAGLFLIAEVCTCVLMLGSVSVFVLRDG